jgi:3-hydroxybutyryl-CoA dehydrogenase
MTSLAGFRMGPFTLMDYIGHDVNYVVTETVFRSFFYDPRYKPAFSQKRLLEAGWLGRKTGRGFYNYAENAAQPTADINEEKGKKIAERILLMLINEAVDALQWQVADKQDIELAMTKGVNYPKGLLHWCDELGADYVLAGMDALYDTYREDRYRASALLRQMGVTKKRFF